MDKLMDQFADVSKFISDSTKDIYEVYLFEIKKRAVSLISENRPSKDYLDQMKEHILGLIDEGGDVVVGEHITSEDYELNKLSIKIIKDENGEPVGAICLSLNCLPFLRLMSFSSRIVGLDDEQTIESKKYQNTLGGIERFIFDFDDEPQNLSKSRKQELICELYDMGMFTIKGSVTKVSELIAMSDKSVYRYIGNIKKLRDFKI